MNMHINIGERVLLALFLCFLFWVLIIDPVNAQYVVYDYSHSELPPSEQHPIIFGVAAYKLCQVKNFLFAAVYIIAAIALVIFAIVALFGRFQGSRFLPIVGSIFLVASADLFIAWMTPNAYYCPTTLSTFT